METMMSSAMRLDAMLPRPNLALDAADALARSIRDGSLAPGDRLPSENEIARKLGISRPVVREAITYLKADGIVESRRGLGLFVNRQDTLRLRLSDIEASEQSLLEFLEFRLGLEVEAAQLAALRHSPEDIERMEAALAGLAEADEAGHDSSEQDLAFHHAIAEAAHNPLFAKVLAFVSAPLLTSIRTMRAKDRGERVHVEIRRNDHQRIFERIRAGDPAGAETAMRDHIGESYRRYAGSMSQPGRASRPHPALGRRP
jgi:GntR family transcriptional regulator, transcriptional repressor for pyruvate dehydrogenase complex